jgi:hypothetical protein
LERLFIRLHERNLTLNKSKCEFNKDKLEFYGHILCLILVYYHTRFPSSYSTISISVYLPGVSFTQFPLYPTVQQCRFQKQRE